MSRAKLTSKGQVTIPAEVRRALGLETGSRVNFVRNNAGVYEIVPETRTVAGLKGLVSPRPEPVTVDKMDEAIEESMRSQAT